MPVTVGESNRAHIIWATCIVLPVLTIIFIFLRIWFRVRVLHSLGWDDYTATMTMFFCITYSILIGISTSRKLVPDISSDDHAGYVQWINDADIIYLVSLLGYKMSILVLYLRLFAVNRKFRYTTWLMMFFVCGYLVSNFWTQIFGCSPRSKYWFEDTPGYCINYKAAGIAYGAMNVISDGLIFILPLPMIWRLKLSTQEKFGVSLIFMSGAITCVVAAVRYYLIVRENQADAKYFIWRLVTCTMEINIGVICSCMPTFKPLFARVMPILSGSKRSLATFGFYSPTRQGTRSRVHESPGPIDDDMLLELGRQRSVETSGRATTRRSSPVGPAVDAGARNIIEF